MRQEVRRGRKFIEYHDPDTQDEHTFTQEISGADVSYQDESGSWLPADENWQTDGLGGFILKNDKLNHKMHWVVGIGVTDDILIADPWTGTIGRLSEMYPKGVLRYGTYSRRNS